MQSTGPQGRNAGIPTASCESLSHRYRLSTFIILSCTSLNILVPQEDAYDAVKTNMYDLLADVALNCQPTQLDMLFAKLERSQARSAQDTERLLTLLEKLALSDAQVRGGGLFGLAGLAESSRRCLQWYECCGYVAQLQQCVEYAKGASFRFCFRQEVCCGSRVRACLGCRDGVGSPAHCFSVVRACCCLHAACRTTCAARLCSWCWS
jgi:hypothetical protein